MIILAHSEHKDLLDKLKSSLQQADDNNIISMQPGARKPEIIYSSDKINLMNAMIEQYHPDVVFIENNLEHPENIETIVGVIDLHPEIAFFLISSNSSSDKEIRMLRAGVIEILPLNFTNEAFFSAINRYVTKKFRTLRSAAKGKIFSFIPCKGGSGSTFISTNLAYALAVNEDKRVLLIDFNLQLGDAALFLSDDKPTATIADVARQIHRLDSNFLASSVLQVLPNLHILASPEEPEKSIDIKAEHVNPILQVAVQNYDVVILDIGRRLDAITIQALDQSNLIFPIVQQTLPFIRDARRLLELFYSLGYDAKKIKFIINRFVKNSEISLEDLEKAIKISVYKTIPNNYDVVEKSVNHGEAVLKLAPKSTVSLALSDIASELCSDGERKNSWLSKMFHKTAS